MLRTLSGVSSSISEIGRLNDQCSFDFSISPRSRRYCKRFVAKSGAPRLLVNVLGKFGRKVVRCKRHSGNPEYVSTKRIESDLLAKLVGLHLSLVALERMITAFYILRSEGAC